MFVRSFAAIHSPTNDANRNISRQLIVEGAKQVVLLRLAGWLLTRLVLSYWRAVTEDGSEKNAECFMPPQETERVLPGGEYADGCNGVSAVCEQI